MQFPKPIQNLLAQARRTSQAGQTRIVKLSATLITPTKHIPLIIPNALARHAHFIVKNADDGFISGSLQPGVYFNNVLPYKDNLLIEIIERVGIKQTSTLYRAIPQGDSNPSMNGSHSGLSNMDALNNRNVVPVTFQLMDPGFDILRNIMVGRIVLMGKLDDVLHNLLTEQGNKLGLQGPNAFRGVDIEKPIDNPTVYTQILIPPTTRLSKLAEFFQTDPHYGLYSKGMGCYYRKGMWYVYPLYKLGRYKTAPRTLDIYRLPEDAIPTLETTYFVNTKGIIVLATGKGDQTDNRDIRRQNKGTGQRIINPDSVAGEAGTYYGRGVSLATRQDSLSEFKTSQRANDNDIVPINPVPQSNIWQPMSENAKNDGQEVIVEWHNSDFSLLTPAMPVRYYYIENDVLKMKEGTLIEVRSDWQPDIQNTSPVFRERSRLRMFLLDAEVVQ